MYRLAKSLIEEDTVYRIKLLLKEGLMLKNGVYQNSVSRWVLSEELAPSKYQHIPLFYTEYQQEFSNNKRFNIGYSRDCITKTKRLQVVVESLSSQCFNEPTEVVFLGKAMGRS